MTNKEIESKLLTFNSDPQAKIIVGSTMKKPTL